ncbi:MAG: hypothetical protein HKN70_02680, partial [Gammaproteobacteria bacterium]|nr:hypothetical protein [Gammaproteobacteria bacterium]
LRYGWTAIAVFLLLGLFLESLHLIKAPFYMEINIRRELWTLAHAHGTLLGIINIVFALCALACLPDETKRARASVTLRAGALLMPVGFLLGGVGNSEVDPSLAIVFVPIGALLVLHAVSVTAVGAWRNSS